MNRQQLQQCTVRIQVGNSHGTGFFVAPGLILTCAHVVKNADPQNIKVHWQKLSFIAKIKQAFPEPHLDLALLEFNYEIPNFWCVELDAEELRAEEREKTLYAYGYTQNYSEGDSATLAYEGNSFKNSSTLYKLGGGQVDYGLSGSPLLYELTGKVCAIISLSINPNTAAGARAVPVAVIFEKFPELQGENQEFHKQHSQRTESNPFEFGKPVPPDRFYGRKRAILDVRNRIGAISPQCINIVGMRRSGRTSLLRYIEERTYEFCLHKQQPIIVFLDLRDSRFHSPVGILEGLRRSITKITGIEPWTKDRNNDPYETEDGLIALRDKGQRLIILFDEFEAIGKKLELFQDWGDDWRSKACAGLLTMVIASNRPLDEIYQTLNLTSPFGNIFSRTVLGTFVDGVWQELVKKGGIGESKEELELIDELAGGLPLYVQMAAALLWQHRGKESATISEIFYEQAYPFFDDLWANLTVPEQQILRDVANNQIHYQQSNNVVDTLKRYGLLRSDGRLFSSAFGEFIHDL